MHIIVVGGNGFIGRHFVAASQAAGHRITVVGRAAAPADSHVDYLPGGLDALSRSPALLSAADAVWHLASSTIPATSNRDPVGDLEENVVPTVRLLEAMREVGNKRILYLSSGGAVYGPPRTVPIPESHPLEPISAYGVGKLAIERFLSIYSASYGFATTVIRPANPYGPGQQSIGQLGIVSTLVSLVQSGGTATIWGDGSIIRDFVHIDDLVAMMLLALDPSATGTFNCGSGSGTSLADLLVMIEGIAGRTITREYKPARVFDPLAIVLDIAQVRLALGWSPRVGLQEGIGALLNASSATQ